jgi:hypothetical protein
VAILALAALGCGGGPSVPGLAIEAPRPRDAAVIASELVHGKTSILMFPRRAAGHALPAKVLHLGRLASSFQELGLDPTRDVDRAFLASPALARGGEEIVVVEHALSEARVRAVIDQLIHKSQPPGAWREQLGVPAAAVQVRGETRIVAMATPTLLVVVPEKLASAVARFASTGGLPDPTGTELAVLQAIDPAQTLAQRHLPRLPTTLRSARATLVLRPDGGAAVDVDAVSTNAAQAARDAAELSKTVDRATSVKIAILRVRFFEPIVFRSEGEHVRARVVLTQSEIDRLLGMAAAFQ